MGAVGKIRRLFSHLEGKRDSGASIVEMAVLAPFLILLLFGVVESSWFLARSIDIAQAAREAGRMAGVNDGDTNTIVAAVCDGMDQPNGALISLAGAGNGLGGAVIATTKQSVGTITGLARSSLLSSHPDVSFHGLSPGAAHGVVGRHDGCTLPMKHLRNNDRGAVAIIVALCLVLLCGMAALAVDMGFGFRERRFDQAGSDAAALGASLEMVITNQTNPVQAAVNNVYQLVNQNLARTVPQADWTACTDAGALFWKTKFHAATLGTTNGSDCISLSQDFNTLRVRVPLQGVDTTFGAVMGFDEFDVTAVAEAQRNTGWGGGGDFPSGVLSGTGAGTTICIKTGTSGGADSCGEPTSGDFGNFRPFFYSAVDGSLASLCVSGEAAVPMARAMADGIDHEFSAYNPVSPNPRVNGKWCQTSTVPGPPFPNIVDSAAGYSNNDITQGLVTGGNWPSTTFTGRLTRGPVCHQRRPDLRCQYRQSAAVGLHR